MAERMQEEDEYNGFPFSKENEHSQLHIYAYRVLHITRAYKLHKAHINAFCFYLSVCSLQRAMTRALSEEHYHLNAVRACGCAL